MKKILTLPLFLIAASALTFAAHGTDDDIVREIEIRRLDVETRSISSTPDAAIYKNILTITFDNSGIFSLYIENTYGEIIYTSTLPADGIEYDYDLSGIGTGLFRLVIEGYGGEYEGIFTF